jgi:LDH2 family malate/lactate/ureidoglycolate dehydrogenase
MRRDGRLYRRVATRPGVRTGVDPGDPESANRARRLEEGVPIDEETWREITLAARGLNVLIEAANKSA